MAWSDLFRSFLNKMREVALPGRFFGIACLFASACALQLSVQPARAEMVEVAPGVRVTKKVYSAPINEQPFFGFVEKTPAMRAADDGFVNGLVQAAGTRERAFEETTLRGWKALALGNLPEASKRFNQAYLLAPERSEVYHGLAAVVQTRFNDIEFAEELFKVAKRQPNPLKNVNADYGRLLMIAKRPRDAQPVLEQAVIDNPDFGDAWSNLAFARLQNGERPAACAAANEAEKRSISTHAGYDMALFKKQAQCE
jgi:tetratricopeptide (TPR) repeat protein